MPILGNSTVIIYFLCLESGVLKNCSKNINHGVFVVGVDADGTWTLRNSWGLNWGEAGHIRLAGGDTCGVCAAPSFPVLKK